MLKATLVWCGVSHAQSRLWCYCRRARTVSDDATGDISAQLQQQEEKTEKRGYILQREVPRRISDPVDQQKPSKSRDTTYKTGG